VAACVPAGPCSGTAAAGRDRQDTDPDDEREQQSAWTEPDVGRTLFARREREQHEAGDRECERAELGRGQPCVQHDDREQGSARQAGRDDGLHREERLRAQCRERQREAHTVQAQTDDVRRRVHESPQQSRVRHLAATCSTCSHRLEHRGTPVRDRRGESAGQTPRHRLTVDRLVVGRQ
jgi:hypothetical protein